MDSASKGLEDRAGISAQAREQDGLRIVHVSTESEIATLERIWGASQDADEAAFKPDDGWWSLHNWATDSWLLLQDEVPVGVTAVHIAQDKEAAEARLALLPDYRQSPLALLLVDHARSMARAGQKAQLRIVASGNTTWAGAALKQRAFSLLRNAHMMSRPALSEPLPVREIDGIRVRSLRTGEEPSLLAALNRAWANTWNFHPITMEALLDDLEGHHDSFFLAVDQADDAHILGTVHALFDRAGITRMVNPTPGSLTLPSILPSAVKGWDVCC
ncbi:GNAT family N-acetyltransferase [Dictyobacter kobayashii]|uniref:N-acetyltransferase domain-containing protein n=1 Tax=Dictyobacter kobayashii TaxID=2014872 RepID=A0A402ANR7_9CHLR|nr:GNAT family N-acetyltransferase [Dictyobacter kobayashii]GCE20756.1 hypothetical protein KDK_45560 [Dictyobacter kobayashii]